MVLSPPPVHNSMVIVERIVPSVVYIKPPAVPRSPIFTSNGLPEIAIPLYERFVALLRERGAGAGAGGGGGVQVATGEFGAMMEVELVNDGPVTLILEK